ncbi:hypothetical protein JCM3775_004503 [Rhodotorula graminis]
MWPFHPTGTRQIFEALFKATRTASPRAARLARQAVRDKKRVEAEVDRTMGPEWLHGAGKAASAAEPTPSSTTSTPTSPEQPSLPTSHSHPDIKSSSLDVPVVRPLQMRPTLAGVTRPQEERRERDPPPAAFRSSAAAARRPGGRQAHAPPVWNRDVSRPRRPAAPAPVAASAETPERRSTKPFFNRHKGLYVQLASPAKTTVPVRRTSAHPADSKPVDKRQVLPSLASIAADRTRLKPIVHVVKPSPHPFSFPDDLPLDLEGALFASHPSSLSSVRLTDPIPRAHFARAFAAEREAKLAEKALEMHPRGASSVDLDTAPTESNVAGPRAVPLPPPTSSHLERQLRSSAPPPSLEEQLFSSFPRGASSVDLGGPPLVPVTTATWTPKVPLRGVQDVGLAPSVPRTDPLENVKARTARTVVSSPQVDNEGMRRIKELRAEAAYLVEENRARAARENVVFQTSPSTTTSPLAIANPSVVASPLAAKPPSPLVEPNTSFSFLTRLDMRSRDPRETNYPVGLRKIFSPSPLDRRIRLAARRASEDVKHVHALAELERHAATEPAATYARWLADVREYRASLRRLRRLEDRCLDGEMARNEEERVGRQLEALVVARVEFEGVVEAYRAYGDVGIGNFHLERGLVDRLVKAQALLDRALVLPGDPVPSIATFGASSSTASKAILWAGDRPFFVEWDAYIRTYRYGASRPLKDLEVLRRRALRKLECVVDRAHMSAFEAEKKARA